MPYDDETRDRFHRLARPAGDGCQEWHGQFNRYGFPIFWHERQPRSAFEFAYELANGRPVPAGTAVVPECDTRACVRPDHLSLEPAPSKAPGPAPSGPLTPAEAAFLHEWVNVLRLSERDASRSLGGLHISTVRRGLRLAMAGGRSAISRATGIWRPLVASTGC
jgi:hypothetical protein